MPIFDYLMDVKRRKGAGYLVLIDPYKFGKKIATEKLLNFCSEEVDAILVGGSFLNPSNLDGFLEDLKKKTNLPLILFPGDVSQLSPKADALFFLSLISGRNPEYLISQQVKAAPLLKDWGVEPISVGYILVESGKTTAVEYISATRSIPRVKVDIAVAHALAAEYIGMKMIYLDAGSGALKHVPEEMISSVAEESSIPLITGGGIRTPEVARKKVLAGSSFVVIGNVLEEKNNFSLLKEFSEAIHIR